jgi:hypothetical protein
VDVVADRRPRGKAARKACSIRGGIGVTDGGNWFVTEPPSGSVSFLWREVRGNQMPAAGHGRHAWMPIFRPDAPAGTHIGAEAIPLAPAPSVCA